MELRRILRPAAAGALLLALSAAAAPQGKPGALAALRSVETGEWQLKDQESGAVRELCLGNPAVLIQLRHGGTQCSHFVIENTSEQATVHYTCPGHGYGRTAIQVETPRLLRIDTQGAIDGKPFSSVFEARRTGTCR